MRCTHGKLCQFQMIYLNTVIHCDLLIKIMNAYLGNLNSWAGWG